MTIDHDKSVKSFKRKVAIYHRISPMYMGGGETVCIHTLEALKEEYDLTLLTVGGKLDFARLNNYFGTDLGRNEISVRFIDPHLIGIADSFLKRVADSSRLNTEFTRLRMALKDRSVSKIRDRFDLVISTQGETAFCDGSLDYIHFPFDRDTAEKLNPDLERISKVPLYGFYDRIVSLIKPDDRDNCERKTTLVNSHWTKNIVKSTYNLDSKVLYPPVRTGDFDPLPWCEKESGFISVGRISPEKKVLRSIEIIDELSDMYNVHLHLIGNVTDAEYGEIVRRKVETSSAVSLEGKVPRKKLIKMVERHKFGIHGMDAEHFGIAVAEMVAGGCIPFVPDDGGQVEIVGENPDLLYANKIEAMAKISRMLDDADLQRGTLGRLEGREEEFSAERFRGKMREFVARKLDSKSQIEGKGDCLS